MSISAATRTSVRFPVQNRGRAGHRRGTLCERSFQGEAAMNPKHISAVLAGWAIGIAALLSMAVPSQADPLRGWKAAEGRYFGSGSSVGARYISPGLMPGDMATATFDFSGDIPLSVFNDGGDPARAIRAFKADPANIEIVMDVTEACNAELSVAATTYERDECFTRYIHGGGAFQFQWVVDLDNAVNGENGLNAFLGVGFRSNKSGKYYSMREANIDWYCNGDEEYALCASCFSFFNSLAAGEDPHICQPQDDQLSIYVITYRVGFDDFSRGRDIAAQAAGTDLQLSLKFGSENGEPHYLNYSMDNLTEALFSNRR
jgi:hypothetical protein